MIRSFSGLCALALLLGSGVVNRLWTGAWVRSNEPAESAARLDRIPAIVGDWDGQALQVDQKQFEVAEAVGHLVRRYVHRRTGQEVIVYLLCGRPGPISQHTPDVCFTGGGWELDGKPSYYTTEASSTAPAAEFLQAAMSKPLPGGLSDRVRVYWSWKASGSWRAPRFQRLAFGAAPALYKLYLIRILPAGEKEGPNDPCREFMTDFLPALEKALSPTEPQS